MAIKHIKEYYRQICNQYMQMLAEIKDFEEEAKQGLMEPERLDAIKEDIRPMKDNYERWSYMMYLLNQPARKEKQKKFERQNKTLLKNIENKNKINSVIDENNAVIDKIKIRK